MSDWKKQLSGNVISSICILFAILFLMLNPFVSLGALVVAYIAFEKVEGE